MQWEVALISFGKLIGFMDANGVFQWSWFLDPKGNTFKGMVGNREHLGLILRALRELPPADSPFFDQATGLRWEALEPFTNSKVGFIWNENKAQPLQIAMGAQSNIPIAGKALDLLALARLLKFTSAGDVSAEFGQIKFGASFPVPDFLAAGTIGGEYVNALTFFVAAKDASLPPADPGSTRTMNFPTGALPWDLARLGTFVLRAFLRKKAVESPAGPPKNFFRRVDDHFFPMLGDPQPNIIQPFPLISDAMGSAPNFDNWRNSILTLDSNASGALTFLWHLRALITGNTSPEILPGSRYFPLISGLQQPAGVPPPVNFTVTGVYPPSPPQTGAWLGVRDSPTVPGATELVVDLRNGQPGPAGVQTIVMLRREGASFVRADMPSGGAFSALTGFLQSITPLNAGGGQITFDAGSGKLKLLTAPVAEGVPGLDGEYSMQIVLRDNEPVAYRVETPLIGMELPPNAAADDPKQLFKKLAEWIGNQVTGANSGAMADVAKGLIKILTDTIDGASFDPALLFSTVAAAVSGPDGIEFGPLSIGVAGGTLTPSVEFGPIQPEDMAKEDVPYSIGKVKLSATLNLMPPAAQPFQGFTIQILDLRLGTGKGTTGTGLVASIIPDMRDMPGFMLKAGFEAPDKIIVEGGGKIPIQKTIGPLDVIALLVEVREKSLTVGIDLSFQLAVIKVTVYELGIRFNFDGPPDVFLHGLGLSFDAGGIKLAGMFAEVNKDPNPPDYVGGAVVSIVNMFQLSAIGAYTEINGKASLFIFAALVAPLGGPPWFFVTGIAGGFGYNRTLPPSGLLSDHPFIKVMRGEIPMGSGDAASLAVISDWFAAEDGTYWIAAGIQFTCFGFINGKVIVSVQFGNKFSFNLLGLASFGISPIAYFELVLSITADEEKLLVIAGLSPNSYIIHPDIFSLRGDFGLGIWYGSPNAGDFVLSIGGYHPFFPKPEHYPELHRVSVKCVVYGFVRLTVEAFFACTPQAIMAGVSVSLSAEFAGIGAGLDLYIDVFITWDPFFLRARMGVCVWFQFFGRHEIGVELDIWTPEFGGIATIDLALVSFDVSFGADLAAPPPPRLDQFVTKQLGVPAERGSGDKAVLQAFNTSEDVAGLFKLDLIWGRTTKEQSKSAKQEGLDTPVPVNAEFGFTLRTKMPLQENDAPTPPVLPLTGEADLPLCEKLNLDSTFDVPTVGMNIALARTERMCDFYPIASFGDKLDVAQADDSGARQAVAKTASKEPQIALTDGIIFHCEAIPAAPPADLVGLSEEDSQADEEYPLPLGAELPLPPFRALKVKVAFKNALPAASIKAQVTHVASAVLARNEVQGRTWRPLRVFEFQGDMQRLQVGLAYKALTYSGIGMLGAPIAPSTPVRPAEPARATGGPPVIGVPSSPQRRPELFAVNLRVVPPRSPIKIERGRLENLTAAKNFRKRPLTDEKGSREPFSTSTTVMTGKAVTLELHEGRPRRGQLVLAGTQTVRAIFQGGAEDVLEDRYVTGQARLEVPKRTRRVTLVGEGMHPPITAPVTAAAPVGTVIHEALGVEHDSSMLALGRRVFAGHGCILVANAALPFAAKPMDAVPGFKVLRGASSFNVHWPAVPKGCLVLTVEPIGGADPSDALNEIRWVSMEAELRGLTTVVSPSSTALVMNLAAPNPWQLEIDLGQKWRLCGVTVVQRSSRDMVNWLRAHTVWDLVDDRLQLSERDEPTKAVLEVQQ